MPSDEIWVAEGACFPTKDKDGNIPGDVRQATFQLKLGMKLYGGFAGGETSLNQRQWNYRATILDGDINHDALPAGNALHVVRGGSYSAQRPEITATVFMRNGVGPDKPFRDTGFRCVREIAR
ncbi:MAG: hypothetical protein ABIF71_08650 [Planctomycetota bacterium]